MKAHLRKNNYTYGIMLSSQSRLCTGERLTLKGGFIPQHVCARVCAHIAISSNYLYAPIVGKSCEECLRCALLVASSVSHSISILRYYAVEYICGSLGINLETHFVMVSQSLRGH